MTRQEGWERGRQLKLTALSISQFSGVRPPTPSECLEVKAPAPLLPGGEQRVGWGHIGRWSLSLGERVDIYVEGALLGVLPLSQVSQTAIRSPLEDGLGGFPTLWKELGRRQKGAWG